MQHSRLSRVLKLSSVNQSASTASFLEFLFRLLISTYVTSGKIPCVSVSLILPLQYGQEMAYMLSICCVLDSKKIHGTFSLFPKVLSISHSVQKHVQRVFFSF